MQEVKVSFHCSTIDATKLLRYYEQITGTTQLEPPYELKDEPKVEAPKVAEKPIEVKEEPKVEAPKNNEPEVDITTVRKIFSQRAIDGKKEDNFAILSKHNISKLSEATPAVLKAIYDEVKNG